MNTTTEIPVFPEAFSAFPPEARAWLFAAAQPIPADKKLAILDGLHDSISKWKSHGTEIVAKATFLDDVTFLVVADFTQAHMSGCSIDRMILSVRETGAASGIDLLDAKGIHYWDHIGLHFVSRQKFGELAAVGAVDSGTYVLDLTRIVLSDVRDGKWKAPAGTTWHRRAFELAAAT